MVGRGLWGIVVWFFVTTGGAEGVEEVRLTGRVVALSAGSVWFAGVVHREAGRRGSKGRGFTKGTVVVFDGVEALNAGQECGRGARRWACGARGTQWLASVVGRERVRCELVTGASGLVSRTTLVVPVQAVADGGAVSDGEHPGLEVVGLRGRCATDRVGDLGREAVRAGYGWSAYHGYRKFEREARAKRRGLWRAGGADVVRPAVWRDQRLDAVRRYRGEARG